MTSEERKTLECAEVRALLPAFLADEIPADMSARIQEHIDACGRCERFRAFEEGFDSLLTRGLRREAAEASLSVRIHEALRREDEGLQGRLRRAVEPPWRRWTALAASLAAVFLAYEILRQRGPLGPAPPAAPPAARTVPAATAPAEEVLTGMLVCAECERHGTPATLQRGCRAFGHHSAFKCEKSGLWEFVETDLTRPLLTDSGRIGEKLEVRGVFLGDLHYVRVSSYRYL